MKQLHCGLIADGSSDEVLLQPLNWLLEQYLPAKGYIQDFTFDATTRGTLEQRIQAVLQKNPSLHLLFVHRDAEKQAPTLRYSEIIAAVTALNANIPFIGVVPIRMTEAWLLIDEQAIREAAGNPRGHIKLNLPPLSKLEGLSDPKATLFDVLKTATGKSGRRLDQFGVKEFSAARFRVAELIQDYSPLRQLSAFQRLEHDVQTFVATLP